MGDSGFKIQKSQNVVFADNIMIGQMKEPLAKDQIILGTGNSNDNGKSVSLPVASTMVGESGIKVSFPSQPTANGNSNTSKISFTLDPDTVTDDFINKVGDKLKDSISSTIIEEVIGELETSPNFSFKKAFNSYSFSDVVCCDGLFSHNNIQTNTCGTEICKISINPENVNASFLIIANIIASRREGTIVLASFVDDDEKPRSLSFGYSNGNPNCCSLLSVIKSDKKKPVSLSIRVGGLDSGPVIVNGLSNMEKILGVDVTSTISILEVSSPKNG